MKIREQEIKKRIREKWEEYAKGEKLNIHLPAHDTTCIYAFGSELGCLRLYKKFASKNNLDKIKVEYSENLKSWFFCLENTE